MLTWSMWFGPIHWIVHVGPIWCSVCFGQAWDFKRKKKLCLAAKRVDPNSENPNPNTVVWTRGGKQVAPLTRTRLSMANTPPIKSCTQAAKWKAASDRPKLYDSKNSIEEISKAPVAKSTSRAVPTTSKKSKTPSMAQRTRSTSTAPSSHSVLSTESPLSEPLPDESMTLSAPPNPSPNNN